MVNIYSLGFLGFGELNTIGQACQQEIQNCLRGVCYAYSSDMQLNKARHVKLT